MKVTVRARRNMARLFGLGLVAVSLLLIGSAATAGADGPQAQLTAKGWWWQAQQDTLPQPLPQPPNVATGQLWVQGAPNGQTAISAVRYLIGTGRVAQTLTLNVVANGDQGGSSAVLIACQTGSAWTSVENGKWSAAPKVTKTCVNGTRSADGKSWSFPLASLQAGQLIDVALTPGPDPQTMTGSTFSLTFDTPSDSSMTTAEGVSTSSTTSGGGSTSYTPGGTSGSTVTGSSGVATGSTYKAPSPVVTPIAPALPPDKVGETATAPAKQAASQPGLNNALAANSTPKNRNKTPGYIVLAFAAAVGLYAFRQDSLMARNGGSLPGAPAEPGGLGRFSRPRQGQPPALT